MIKDNIRNKPFFGIGLALFGALIITPDTLLIRLSGLDGWGLTISRGALIGITLLSIWLFISRRDIKTEFKNAMSIPFLLLLLSSGTSNISFNFATTETQITVVLSTLATMPIMAAILSIIILREKPASLTWLAVFFCFIGVLIVIFNAQAPINNPSGNIFLGGIFSLISAFGLSLFFILSRKYPNTPIILAVALGNLISCLVGFMVSPDSSIFGGNIIPILLMGIVVMPTALICLAFAPRYTSATNVSLLVLLEMILGPFWVWMGTGEQPNLMVFYGAVLVLFTLLTYFYLTSKELATLKT